MAAERECLSSRRPPIRSDARRCVNQTAAANSFVLERRRTSSAATACLATVASGCGATGPQVWSRCVVGRVQGGRRIVDQRAGASDKRPMLSRADLDRGAKGVSPPLPSCVSREGRMANGHETLYDAMPAVQIQPTDSRSPHMAERVMAQPWQLRSACTPCAAPIQTCGAISPMAGYSSSRGGRQ